MLITEIVNPSASPYRLLYPDHLALQMSGSGLSEGTLKARRLISQTLRHIVWRLVERSIYEARYEKAEGHVSSDVCKTCVTDTAALERTGVPVQTPFGLMYRIMSIADQATFETILRHFQQAYITGFSVLSCEVEAYSTGLGTKDSREMVKAALKENADQVQALPGLGQDVVSSIHALNKIHEQSCMIFINSLATVIDTDSSLSSPSVTLQSLLHSWILIDDIRNTDRPSRRIGDRA